MQARLERETRRLALLRTLELETLARAQRLEQRLHPPLVTPLPLEPPTPAYQAQLDRLTQVGQELRLTPGRGELWLLEPEPPPTPEPGVAQVARELGLLTPLQSAPYSSQS